jgi:Fe-S cluster assembly iron-binding protein IscA
MTAVAENIPTDMPAPILFTDSAAAKVADLIAEEGNPDLKLRVYSSKVADARVFSMGSRLMKSPTKTIPS